MFCMRTNSIHVVSAHGRCFCSGSIHSLCVRTRFWRKCNRDFNREDNFLQEKENMGLGRGPLSDPTMGWILQPDNYFSISFCGKYKIRTRSSGLIKHAHNVRVHWWCACTFEWLSVRGFKSLACIYSLSRCAFQANFTGQPLERRSRSKKSGGVLRFPLF